MKISTDQVRFQTAMWWPTRRRVNFVGRSGTLQLLETAMIVEGYRQRFFFPVLDRFFQQALSEWTTVTVPYSRVVDTRHESRTVARTLLTLLCFAPTLMLALAFLANGGLFTQDGMYFLGMASLGSLVLSLYFAFFRLASRNWLIYREPDGTRALLLFRIQAKKRRLEFEAALERNRAASSTRVEPVKDVKDDGTSAFVPLLVLTLMVVGTWVGEGARLYFGTPPGPFKQALLTRHLSQGLLTGVPILALAFAIWSRHLGWRLVAAGMTLLRGVVPVFALASTGPVADGTITFVWCVFHAVLALVVVFAVPGRKEGR